MLNAVSGRQDAVTIAAPQDTTNRKNMLLLVQLRWIAASGQLVAIGIAQGFLGISLPLGSMACVLGALLALNALSYFWARRRTEVSSRALFMSLILDVAALTAQLYLSGGASNPFTGLYLMQVALAVALDVAFAWTIVGLAAAAFFGLTLFYTPLTLTHLTPDLFTLHLAGTFVCFVLDAALLVFFLIRITGNLRDRDARLAALKQQSAEHDLIVRMGLLASGAAHELGTPLASVDVILGDWRRMPEIRDNAALAEDIAEMQAAIRRCKSIVTGILRSAGEARGDAPAVTTVNEFLTAIGREWTAATPSANLQYENAFGSDVPIVADSSLKQIVFNLLDNAFEVSPNWIQLTAKREGDTLLIEVQDAGPGFAKEILERLGAPYQSTKDRGGGLGLFLVVNVARKLGGSVSARNRPEGGAAVSLHLPLRALTFGTNA
jgi:two-component system sensor histidine kinase RegB